MNELFCIFNSCGTNQYNQKDIVITTKTAPKLAAKSIKAQNEFTKFHIDNSIQTVANGKSNDTANETQITLLFQNLSYFIHKTAIIAEKIAMKKSIIFGSTLAKISQVSILNQVSTVIKYQTKIAKSIEIHTTFRE